LHPLLASQGVEPLSEAFTVDWIFKAISKRSGPIKPTLMDSHLVVGIGNIYASESLFRAGISRCGRPTGSVGRAMKILCRPFVKRCQMPLPPVAAVFAIMCIAMAAPAAFKSRPVFMIGLASRVCAAVVSFGKYGRPGAVPITVPGASIKN
jgi:hypothetical protein